MPALDWGLEQKVVVVTGGSRGIGRSIALGLASAGADVVIASRDGARCIEVAGEVARRGVRGIGVRCDVSKEADILSLFDTVSTELGGTDVFIHCAGVATSSWATEATREELQQMLDIHYLGGLTGAQCAASQMRGRGGGSIIFVTSVWGLGGQPKALAYGGAKAALAQSVRTLSIEWARDGIRVNGLAPGLVATEMTSHITASDDLLGKMVRQIPLGRAAEPEEMAGPALFLASRASSYVTGQILVADGGWRAR